jgi:hypothetical protein
MQDNEHENDGGRTGYNASKEDRPLGAYALLIAAFNATFALFLLAVRRSGRSLPERPRPDDLLLLGVATHKLSRLLTKDTVTSVLRAPFARYQGPAGAGEVNDAPRGRGLRHAVGELLTCPFCLGQWVATGFAIGTVFAPKVTRLVASAFAAVDVADFLQFGWAKAQQATEG